MITFDYENNIIDYEGTELFTMTDAYNQWVKDGDGNFSPIEIILSNYFMIKDWDVSPNFIKYVRGGAFAIKRKDKTLREFTSFKSVGDPGNNPLTTMWDGEVLEIRGEVDNRQFLIDLDKLYNLNMLQVIGVENKNMFGPFMYTIPGPFFTKEFLDDARKMHPELLL